MDPARSIPMSHGRIVHYEFSSPDTSEQRLMKLNVLTTHLTVKAVLVNRDHR